MSLNRRLFDSSSLVTPPEPELDATTCTRELTPEEKEEARRESARRCLDSMSGQRVTVPPMSARVGFTMMTEYRFRI